MSALSTLVDRDSLEFIFVGGKGGVGKTTSSCALACLVAGRRRRAGKGDVLLVSTDPAHNTSDAFGQSFGDQPQAVRGVQGLWALEIDPSAIMAQAVEQVEQDAGLGEQLMADFKEWLGSAPGIDEAMALSTVLEHVESGKFGCIVFDTAPTGHTLRLLSLPHVLQLGIDKLTSWKTKLSGMIDMVAGMFSAGGTAPPASASVLLGQRLQEYQEKFAKIAGMLADEARTTFVCVCIAELLSVCETDRLLDELASKRVSSQVVIVNQLIPPPPASPTAGGEGGRKRKRHKAASCGSSAEEPAPHLARKKAIL
eukprot:g7324.t1